MTRQGTPDFQPFNSLEGLADSPTRCLATRGRLQSAYLKEIPRIVAPHPLPLEGALEFRVQD
jgi:hypothetical protein